MKGSKLLHYADKNIIQIKLRYSFYLLKKNLQCIEIISGNMDTYKIIQLIHLKHILLLIFQTDLTKN